MWDFVQSFPGGTWRVLILLAAYAAGSYFMGSLKK